MRLRVAICFMLACSYCSIARSQFNTPATLFSTEGMSSMADNVRKVTDVKVINRTPLFDNAPFLKLKKGDKFVKARAWYKNGKGVSPGFSDDYDYYICSQGVYYHVWALLKKDKLILRDIEVCVLLDWEVTLENGRQLHNISKGWGSGQEMSYQQYHAIATRMKKEFPKVKFYSLQTVGGLRPEKLVSNPRFGHLVFEGIAYEPYWNFLYKYKLKIGPNVRLQTMRIIATGPKHIDRKEFEGYHPNSSLPNPGGVFSVSPEVAKVKKKQFDEMVRFQKIVYDVIQSK